jgi:hypothetical protein
MLILSIVQTMAKINNIVCVEFYRGVYWDVYATIRA